jgi:hypothetical protein
MIEKTGDIWESSEDYICITTNGYINVKGECVMGKGIALQCKERFPEFPKILGNHILKNNNIPMINEKLKI